MENLQNRTTVKPKSKINSFRRLTMPRRISDTEMIYNLIFTPTWDITLYEPGDMKMTMNKCVACIPDQWAQFAWPWNMLFSVKIYCLKFFAKLWLLRMDCADAQSSLSSHSLHVLKAKFSHYAFHTIKPHR